MLQSYLKETTFTKNVLNNVFSTDTVFYTVDFCHVLRREISEVGADIL